VYTFARVLLCGLQHKVTVRKQVEVSDFKSLDLRLALNVLLVVIANYIAKTALLA